MSLAVGSVFGAYRIVSLLGAGGMGEVYRAKDSRLGRDVALKLLPEPLSSDPSRLSRFEREAQVLASLNHPSIVTVYSVERVEGVAFFTMELIEGDTLLDLIPKGGLPLDQILAWMIPVAGAVSAAHDRGVVHRDLKSSNIMISDEGQVKILDFGVAKFRVKDPDDATAVDVTPPLSELTRQGQILGTTPYMSPEQAAGGVVDARSDLFSLGIVLYEMSVGERPFKGRNESEIRQSIITGEPEPLPEIRPSLPREFWRIVNHCLAKNPTRRYQTALDVRNELEEFRAELSSMSTDSWRQRRRSAQARLLPWALGAGLGLALVALAVVLASGSRRPEPAIQSLKRWDLRLPSGSTVSAGGQGGLLDLSPDGRRLVYAVTVDGVSHLEIRGMDELESHVVPGTEGAYNPFFSPDGNWIGFFADGDLKKVSVSGGLPLHLFDTKQLHVGATWAADGSILFAMGSDLWRVGGDGGEAERVATPRGELGELAYFSPQRLSGSDAFLVTIWRGRLSQTSIARVSLADGGVDILEEHGTSPRYDGDGRLLFVRDGQLFSKRYDPGADRPGEAPRRVVGKVRTERYGVAHYAVAEDGSLVYVPGSVVDGASSLFWVDRNGDRAPLGTPPMSFRTPRLSPDDQQVAVRIADENGTHIWLYEIERNSFTRLTTEGMNVGPEWLPDGRGLVFSSDREGDLDLYYRAVGSSDPPTSLLRATDIQYAESFSADGRLLLFSQIDANDVDTWMLTLDDGSAEPLLEGEANDGPAKLSPDGRWLAYVSDETGQDEIWVRGFGDDGGDSGRRRLSTNGGIQPLWSPDGSELFFLSAGRMMVVETLGDATSAFTDPRALFDIGRSYRPGALEYDVDHDGSRFLMVLPTATEDEPDRIEIVLGWYLDG